MNDHANGAGGRGGSSDASHEVARIVARDLAPVVFELASLKGEVYRDLERHHEYRALAHRLEVAFGSKRGGRFSPCLILCRNGA